MKKKPTAQMVRDAISRIGYELTNNGCTICEETNTCCAAAALYIDSIRDKEKKVLTYGKVSDFMKMNYGIVLYDFYQGFDNISKPLCDDDNQDMLLGRKLFEELKEEFNLT